MIGARNGFAWRLVGLTLFIALAAVVFAVLFNIAGGINVGERYRFTAVVPTAVQLSTNADVTDAGVRIGRVEAVSGRGATAVLRIALNADRGPIRRDARVQVRAKTLVGENYVELDPGSPSSPVLPEGGELPIRSTRPTTQLDDILEEMSPARQTRVKRLFAGLGPGLGNPKDVGAALTGVADLMQGGKALAEPLAAERQALRVLVADLGTVFRAVGERGDALRLLIRAGRTSSRAVAAEDAAVRAGLRELAPTLGQTRRTTARLAAVGTRALPVMDDLTVALERLTPLMADLPSAARTTLGALTRLQAATPTTRKLLTALRRLAGPGAAVVPPLDGALRELRPILAYLAPYDRDIGSFFAGLGQSVSGRDATGNVARLQPVVSPAALTLVGEPERKAIDTLLGMGVGRLINIRGANNQPEPDRLATPKAFSGPYPRLQPDPRK
jgi:phospholipid/cholesterol/gamma-HCH transport system substrate-binding protein